MKTYITKQGDMWDSIAHTQLGNAEYSDKLMKANLDKLHYYTFPAGISLVIPKVDTKPKQTGPPWKKVSG